MVAHADQRRQIREWGRTALRYYMASLMLLVFGFATLMYFIGPVLLGVGLVVVAQQPLWVGVVVSIVTLLFALPLGVWMAYGLPKLWRDSTRDYERELEEIRQRYESRP